MTVMMIKLCQQGSVEGRRTDGSYSFRFSTDTGMSRAERGGMTARGWGVEGSYQYRGRHGQIYRVTFTADHNGYRPRYVRREEAMEVISRHCRISKISPGGLQSETDLPPRRRRQRHLYRDIKTTARPVRRRRKRVKINRLQNGVHSLSG